MAIVGQRIVATSGVPLVFSTATIGPGTYLVRAHPANAGTYCYIGYTSQTATTLTGYPMNKTDDEITITVAALEDLWVNSDKTSDVVCFIRSEGENIGRKAPAG